MSNYSFTQASGTYTNLTTGTVLFNEGDDFQDETPVAVTIPAFWYAGAYYTTMHVTSNGFITFGSAPSSTQFTPLSSSATYSGAISAYGCDIEDASAGGNTEIRWANTGTEIVVQWRDVERNISFNDEVFSFQVRMTLSTGVIRFVYSSVTNVENSTSIQPQVGLRGSSNTFPADVRNRLVNTTAGSTTWNTSINGASASSTCRFTSGTTPASGQTYTFTPPCALPTQSNAGPDQTICSTDGSATMAANTPSVGTGTWTLVSGTGTITTPSSPTTTVTGLGASGARTLRWTITNGTCVSFDDVVINVNGAPTTADAGSDQSICASSGTATMNGNAPTTGTGTWTKTSGGTATIATPSSRTTTITGLTVAGSPYVFRWTIANSPCTASFDEMTVVVNPNPTANPTADLPVCIGSPLNLNGATDIGTTFAWSGPNSFTSTSQNPSLGNATMLMSGTYSFTATASPSGCSTTGTTVVNLNPLPGGVVASSSALAVCSNANTIDLTTTTSSTSNLLSQGWNSGAGGWTTTNNSTGGTVADAAWTIRPNGYFFNASSGTDPTFNSNDNTAFFLTNSDDQGSGGTTATILTSPAFSTVGYSAVSLSYFHHYRYNSGTSDRAFVEVSTNNTTWTTLTTYSSTQGAANGFVQATANLNSVAGQPTVYIRFRYTATFDWWWAVDNVSITGTAPLTFAWTSTPPGFTSALQNPTGVAVGANTTYNVLVTNPLSGCEMSGSVAVTVDEPPVASITPQSSTTFCAPGSVILDASAGSSYLWSPGGATTPSITATTSGSYTVAVTDGACTVVSPAVSVTAGSAPGLSNVTATPATVCEGDNSLLNVTATLGYCASTHSSGCGSGDAITSTSFADLTNNTGCSLGGYADHTGMTAEVLAGNIYAASVTMGSNATQFAAIWIDWNADGDFYDADEFIGTSGNVGANGTANFSIEVPVNAANGPVRMRVIGGNNSAILMGQSCGASSSAAGETEDYTVNITGGTGTGITYLWAPGASLDDATSPTPVAMALTPGSNTYTVTAASGIGCTSTATVTVNGQAQPNAGADNTLFVCNIDAAVNMGALLGAHDAGTWSGPSPVSGDLYDPATMDPGTYVYTVTAAPCADATATITVTENAATPRYADVDGDGFGDASDMVLSCDPIAGRVSDNSDCDDTQILYVDADGDGFGTGSPVACGSSANNMDDCPTVVGLIGSNCDAQVGPGFVLGQLNNACQCIQIACTENVVLELRTDANSDEAGWEILDQNTNLVICSGGAPADPFPNGITSPITPECCLPVGCYRLRVLDSGGDGFVSGGITGGYQLREQGINGRRIIDNFGNFTSGSSSGIGNAYENGAFCVPVGNDRPIFASCDKLDWVPNQFIVASENAAVSAEFGTTNMTSGYEFWFFDPNGGYSFRRFRNHATSDGFGHGATRACHMKINSWSNSLLTPHLPSNVLLNVRIRGRVAGDNVPFGPACLFKIDALRASCPLVKLQDNPLNTADFSCGVTKYFGGVTGPGNRIVANPPQFAPAAPAGQVRYQFRFRIPGENVCIVRPAQTSPTLQLNWSTGDKLECSKTYEVDVRVSKDGGASWCTANSEPTCGMTVTPWGKICNVNISTSTFCPGELSGGSNNLALQSEGALTMYPNPNRGDQVYIKLSAVENDVNTVIMEVHDLTGKRIVTSTIPVMDGMVNRALELNGDLSDGVYLVNITAGTKTYTQRLIIQK